MNISRLVTISDLSFDQVKEVVETALDWESRISHGENPWPPMHTQETVGLIFLEPSTRTRISFERAAQVIGFSKVIVEAKGSSFEKGETLSDSIWNLVALGVRHFVVRTPNTGELMALETSPEWRVINGGDGTGEHPTQALLDLATLVERFSPNGSVDKLRGLRMAIVGDTKHSRVVGSWLKLAPMVGIELSLLSPSEWAHPGAHHAGAAWSDDKVKALKGVQAVMGLRVQKERISQKEGFGDLSTLSSADFETFKDKFQIKPKDLMADTALLHPGPVNWGIELDPALRTDPRSLILRQVALGVATRAVILASAGVA